MILLVQRFTGRMPLLTATSAFGFAGVLLNDVSVTCDNLYSLNEYAKQRVQKLCLHQHYSLYDLMNIQRQRVQKLRLQQHCSLYDFMNIHWPTLGLRTAKQQNSISSTIGVEMSFNGRAVIISTCQLTYCYRCVVKLGVEITFYRVSGVFIISSSSHL